MKTATFEKTNARAPITSRLFDDPTEQILLSIHLLGKPTAAQLFKLHSDKVSTLRQMQGILRRLSSGPDRWLNVINPTDIANPIRSLPYIYLDTTKSRRFLEERFGIPYRRVPPVPSRDWRFLRHDVEMCDELVLFELSAREQDLPFGYVPHVDPDKGKLYPKVTIHHDGLTHRLRPDPDKTLIMGDTHIILEHDCGEEIIGCGNIIRDASIGRKQLVYDQLFKMGWTKQVGWGRTIVLYVIDAKRGTEAASRKRIKKCIEKFPEGVDRGRTFFVTRQGLVGLEETRFEHHFIRSDGMQMSMKKFQ